jgi:hypothetical protein
MMRSSVGGTVLRMPNEPCVEGLQVTVATRVALWTRVAIVYTE